MTEYNIIHIFTVPVILFSVYKLMNTFFTDGVHNKKLEVTSYIAYAIATSVLIFLTRVPIVLMVLNIIFIFLISLNYISSINKKLVMSIFFYSILLVVELLISVFIGVSEISIFENSTFKSEVGLILIRTTSMIITYLISRYKVVIRKNFAIPLSYYLGLLIILFGTLYLFVMSLDNDNLTIYSITVSGLVLIVVNITLMVIDEKIYKSIILEYRQKTLKQHNDALENQMELIYQSSESIRILKHDFKNHLIMLSNLYKNGSINEIEPYINSLLGSIDNQALANSNNFVIDSIINFKLNNTEHSDIKVNLDLNVPFSLGILAHDLTAIIANLLDNAIVACEKSNEKILDIKINCKLGNLIILINNSYNGEIIEENGILKTTKMYNANHGLGIKSVGNILKKYDGELRTEYTSNMFSVSVIIPY